ncbi:hypothetical protein RHGRI_023148 [Rhododendron griersonianum]|uniref:Uncharacterized protein n=1 Tax=Rhododendron griersonianum TaxID=479676 RepID=A0AAV6J7X3_9ERIC|nr:hypothetical protein RHGRI_023148 [Rhododendron griersonianum]
MEQKIKNRRIVTGKVSKAAKSKALHYAEMCCHAPLLARLNSDDQLLLLLLLLLLILSILY